MRFLLIATALVLIEAQCQAAKILAFFPMPAKSHHNVFQPILTQLAKRGHLIDYYSPFPMHEPNQNVTLIKTKDFMRTLVEKISAKGLGEQTNVTTYKKIVDAHRMFGLALDEICNIPEIIDLIKSEREYDLVIHEGLFFQDYANALAHKFKAPAVSTVPCGEWSTGNELAGLPDNPSYMMDFKTSYSDRMSFFEKLHNTYVTAFSVLGYYYSLHAYQKKVDECFRYPGWESRPPLPKLASDNALILTNSHHSFGFSFPKAPHFKEIGGVNILPNKPLPKELETYINGAKHGVVYFSLGSVVDMTTMLDPRFKEIFTKVFGRLKEHVLWKWNGEAFEVPKNVKLQKWFPQQDILAHKNVKLFISHGGLLSCFEAVHNVVPILATPVFADQPKNAHRIAHLGIGDYLNWKDINEESLYIKIRTLIDDPKYKEQAMRRSALMVDRPMTPVQEAVYWIEYIIKHGRVLQPYAVHLSFVELHMLDVYGFILVSLLAVYFAVKYIACFLTKTLLGRGQPMKMSSSETKKRQ